MCGIAGVWTAEGDTPAGELAGQVRRMTDAVAHRGPDDEGVWTDAGARIGLGHRRLAIIDLSPEGHQPMVSASARYIVTFNGELYNFAELRRTLADEHRYPFRGSSDTEVLLAAFDVWGLDGTLQRADGMFAFALWDARARELHLVRDRIGEKPLYYGWLGTQFVFGSELRAIRAATGGVGLEVDRNSLALYLRLNYLPAPHSIFRGVAKLPAGCVLTVRSPSSDERPQARSYWPLRAIVTVARERPGDVSDAEATDELDGILRDAVRLRMHADVPLGAFLSGGIDSSTVVALMQDQAERPVRTFTVGFSDAGLDESGAARAVARHLRTDHTEIQLSPQAALDLIPKLPTIYDEPFADPSQLPTTAIAQVARRHVTVCLSGDGGDEVFAGYNRYTLGERVWGRVGRVPQPVRTFVGRSLLSVPAPLLNQLLPQAKVQKLAAVLDAGSPADVFRALVSSWDNPDTLVVDGHEHPGVWSNGGIPDGLDGVAEQMMYLDSLSTLPDEMLAKVDRATMSVALETRVPLLAPRVVEHAWSLPPGMRIRDGHGKWLLRQVLHRYVPAELVERPKQGFDPPVAEWLRGPLRPWAEDLLDAARLRREGYLRPEPIRRCWADHLRGARDWDYRLWAVLMFQSWLETWNGP